MKRLFCLQGQYPAGIQQLYSNLLQLLSPSQGPASNLQGQLHWRYALMANSILMFLLPPPNAQVAAQLMRHCLSLLLTQQISQQSIGMSGVLFLLRPGAPWRKVGDCGAALHGMLLGLPSPTWQAISMGRMQLPGGAWTQASFC